MVLQKALAARMKTAMRSQHLSVLGIAEKTGISKSTAQVYLHEKGNPRADTIELIYEKLGHPVETLLPGNSESDWSGETPDFLSLADRCAQIHPWLKPLVLQSYRMAQVVLDLSDFLYQMEARKEGSD